MDHHIEKLYRVLKLIDQNQDFNYYALLDEQDMVFELVKMKLVCIEGQLDFCNNGVMLMKLTDKGRQLLKSYEQVMP